jgi:hypothetical protein
VIPDTETEQSKERNRKLGVIAACGCFLIGFWHTGLGLAPYRLLSSDYGGFLFGFLIVVLMILAYRKAVHGSQVGLNIYLVCALVTFACNLNSFYPNYRGDALVREELREHRAALADLKEAVGGHFKDVKLDGLAADVEAKSRQLSEQIKQRGFGPRAEEDLRRIEAALGRPIGTITRLKLGKTESEWDNIAKQYELFIEGELKTVLTDNRYIDKRELMRMADDYLEVFSRKIDESLNSKISFSRPPPYVEDLVKGYRETCKKAVALAITANKAKPFESCNQTYASANVEIGTFSHTFRSVGNTLGDGGTITILITTLFLDFLFPLFIYLLVRRRPPQRRSEEDWTTGGKNPRPTVAT